MTITAQRLRDLLSYDADTGVFTRNSDVRGGSGMHGVCARAGEIAGAVSPVGYRVIQVDGVRYRAHRLAWFCVFGVWPTHEIDHIDGNRDNNRICNLRDVTRTVNQQNLHKIDRRNKSGYTGVHWHGPANAWRAMIGANKRLHFLGNFASPQLAHAAYLTAKHELHNKGQQ